MMAYLGHPCIESPCSGKRYVHDLLILPALFGIGGIGGLVWDATEAPRAKERATSYV